MRQDMHFYATTGSCGAGRRNANHDTTNGRPDAPVQREARGQVGRRCVGGRATLRPRWFEIENGRRGPPSSLETGPKMLDRVIPFHIDVQRKAILWSAGIERRKQPRTINSASA